MFRSYNNCYYSSSEPVTDEGDELYQPSNLYLLIGEVTKIKAYNKIKRVNCEKRREKG